MVEIEIGLGLFEEKLVPAHTAGFAATVNGLNTLTGQHLKGGFAKSRSAANIPFSKTPLLDGAVMILLSPYRIGAVRELFLECAPQVLSVMGFKR